MPLIPISFDNVMNGLNKGIHMRLLCPTRHEAHEMYRRAHRLWHIDGYTIVRSVNMELEIGPKDGDRVAIQMKVFEAIHNDSWRGFHGVYMLHPAIERDKVLLRHAQMLEEMTWHNERFLDKWQS